MPVAAGDWLAVGDGEGDMLPIMCFAPCFAALSATELPPGTLLVFCQSVPKKMHAVTQIHTRMSTPINPTAAFIRGDARVLFSVLIQTRTQHYSVANAKPGSPRRSAPGGVYRRGPMRNVGSFDPQLRLNGRPDLGTKRSYRALPKALRDHPTSLVADANTRKVIRKAKRMLFEERLMRNYSQAAAPLQNPTLNRS
jgi:hypothetical protein